MSPINAARLLATRAALRAARSPVLETLLRVATLAAGNDRSANSALYYVAIRYFGATSAGRKAALSAARDGALTPSVHLHPLTELGITKHERRSQSALYVINGMLDGLHGDNGGRSGVVGADQLLRSMQYAKSLLQGDFVDAYRHWLELACATGALDALHAHQPRNRQGGTTFRWHDDATLAVVLPGSLDMDRREEIEGHTLVGRTAWHPGYIPKPETGARTDIAFFNQDRFLDLANHGFCKEKGTCHEIPLIATKASAQSRAKPPPAELAARIQFDLVEPELPTSRTTYLVVPIALWAMANLQRPATFYFADFYLGQQLYQDASYDSKQLLETANDIRRSYLAHDVFFVHAALRKWVQDGKIIAVGKLGEILSWQGDEFARRLQHKWGRISGEEVTSAYGS